MANKADIIDRLVRRLKDEGATRVAVFGSYARGEEEPQSDSDVIVEFADRKSLLDLVRIERELSEALGVKVDLLTERSISPYLIAAIRKDMQVVYG